MQIVRLLLAVILGAAFAAVSSADGMYFEEYAVNGSSSIPHQRAIIAHKDGKELMIVESTLRGKQGNYAWIVPVPSVPSTIERADRYLFEDLKVKLEPIVTNSYRYPNRTLWIYAFLITTATLFAAYRIKAGKSTYAKSLIEIGLLTFISVILVFVFRDFSNYKWYYRDSEGALGEEATVFKAGEAGNYNFVVLGAKDGTDAVNWLNAHGYRVPDSSKRILSAYAAKGWKFFAATLKHSSKDQSHPIALEFQSETPIYPMALTATGNPPLDLDLYLFGEGNAYVRGMDFIASTDVTVGTYFNEGTRKQELDIRPVNDDILRPYMQDGQIITRLHGHYDKSIPSHDFMIRFNANTNCYQAVLTTPTSASYNAIGYSLLIYSSILLVSGIGLLRWRHALPALATITIIALGFCAIRAINEYRLTPKSSYDMNTH